MIRETKQIFLEQLELSNAPLPENQLDPLYNRINDYFFSKVSPIFTKEEIKKLSLSDNKCEIVERFNNGDYQEVDNAHIRLSLTSHLPTSYIQEYSNVCEYFINKQGRRNNAVLRGMGVHSVEDEELGEIEGLERKFFYLPSSLIIQ
jgi:hypothetical protein